MARWGVTVWWIDSLTEAQGLVSKAYPEASFKEAEPGVWQAWARKGGLQMVVGVVFSDEWRDETERPEPGSQRWAETYQDDLGESPDF